MPNRIKELREKKNLNQTELAQKIEKSTNAISKYENGDRWPRIEDWQKLADIFGVPVTYLQGLDNPAKNFLDWGEQIQKEAQLYEDALINEALNKDSYQAGVNSLKGLKQGFIDGYQATTEQIIQSLLNSVVDSAIRNVRNKAMGEKPND